MDLDKVEGLKRYTPEDFTKLTIEILERTARNSPEKIEVVIDKRYKPEPVELLKEVYVCRNSLEHDDEGVLFELWEGEYPLDTSNGSVLESVIENLKKADKLLITVFVLLIIPLGKDKYIGKFYDKLFVARHTSYPLHRCDPGEYLGFEVRDDFDSSTEKQITLYEIPSMEVLCKLIDEMPKRGDSE